MAWYWILLLIGAYISIGIFIAAATKERDEDIICMITIFWPIVIFAMVIMAISDGIKWFFKAIARQANRHKNRL